MNKLLGLISVALLLLGSLFLASEQLAANFGSIIPGYKSSAKKIPDNVLYESMFRLDVKFQDKAKKQESAGEPVTPLINYFKEQLDLDDDESEMLHKKALEFSDAVQPVDKRADEIIDGIRKQFPEGKVKEGDKVPPPPSELTELQAKRDWIVMDYRDRLQNALGSARFKSVDEKVKNKFSKNFEALEDNVGSRRQK